MGSKNRQYLQCVFKCMKSMPIIAKDLMSVLVYYTLLIFIQTHEFITYDDCFLIDYEHCSSAMAYDLGCSQM